MLRDALDPSTIKGMYERARTHEPKVIRIASRKYVFVQEGEGRRLPGGLPPKGISVSSLNAAIESAHVFGVRGGLTKMIRFEPPKRRVA